MLSGIIVALVASILMVLFCLTISGVHDYPPNRQSTLDTICGLGTILIIISFWLIFYRLWPNDWYWLTKVTLGFVAGTLSALSSLIVLGVISETLVIIRKS